MSIILGVDPGSRITGYGIIATEGRGWRYVDSGCIRMKTEETLPERVLTIFQGLSQVIAQWQPTQASVEQVFLSNNADSALKLGQARGAALVAIGHAGISVAEYSARQIKQSVVGTGAADKVQVQHMVMRLLQLQTCPQADAADALAAALCHAHANANMLKMTITGLRRGRGR